MEHLCPKGTEVVGFTSFDDACRAMLENPPDAVVVSITSAHLPWRAFRDVCKSQTPAVPVLYESCVFSNAEEAGLEPGETRARFLHTPAPMAEFEAGARFAPRRRARECGISASPVSSAK